MSNQTSMIDITIADAVVAEMGRTSALIEIELAREDVPEFIRSGLERRQRQVEAAWAAFKQAGDFQ